MHKNVRFGSEEIVLVSCSNLIKLKRVGLIIQAIASLPENIRITWNHIGDGPEKDKLYKLAENILSPKENIKWKFWGYIPNKDIEKIYQKIGPQLFITVSSSEGLPVSVQEAFAMGIPAIGTDVGGMRELIIDNKTGFLLQSDPTVEEIVKAINKFYHMLEWEKEEMSDMAFQIWDESFDAKKKAKDFVKTIENL